MAGRMRRSLHRSFFENERRAGAALLSRPPVFDPQLTHAQESGRTISQVVRAGKRNQSLAVDAAQSSKSPDSLKSLARHHR
jgi:hypothetical protein